MHLFYNPSIWTDVSALYLYAPAYCQDNAFMYEVSQLNKTNC